ncbi:MAG: sigma-54 interaction domain-containing protein [Peptostreptococcaceae bacterium]
MKIIDAVITLDKHLCILNVKSSTDYFTKFYEKLFKLHINNSIHQVLEINLNQNNGIFTWNLEQFYYEYITTGYDLSFLFIKKNIPANMIFGKVLDSMYNGVHVYDKNANLIYYNKASSSISLETNEEEVLGKHLTDIFPNINPKYSTILTTLKTKSPVINRCDTFKSSSGKNITTINSAYPILYDNDLVGSWIIERDLSSIQKNISDLTSMKDLITKQSSNLPLENEGIIHSFADLKGESTSFKKAIQLAKKVSSQDCNVLIYGETGTGKELFAQSIHKNSKRCKKKFLAINCAAIPENLIEGILFGTTKGAFTGSIDKAGLFEEANGGTIFLDELNSMNLLLQSKLLRFLQDGTFMRVGGKKIIKSDVRIISSCNEDPFYITNNNILRKDLFYRISTIIVNIPPLRDRYGDVELLLNFFIHNLGNKYYKTITHISEDVLQILNNYTWPGNVRELMHVVEYALNTIEESNFELNNLPIHLLKNIDIKPVEDNCEDTFDSLQSIMDSYECEVIKKALKHYNYNVSRTAQALDLRRQSLQYRIKKYGIII